WPLWLERGTPLSGRGSSESALFFISLLTLLVSLSISRFFFLDFVHFLQFSAPSVARTVHACVHLELVLFLCHLWQCFVCCFSLIFNKEKEKQKQNENQE